MAKTKQIKKEEPLTNIQRLENLVQQRTQLEIALTKVQGAIEVVGEIVKTEGENKDGEKTKG